MAIFRAEKIIGTIEHTIKNSVSNIERKRIKIVPFSFPSGLFFSLPMLNFPLVLFFLVGEHDAVLIQLVILVLVFG